MCPRSTYVIVWLMTSGQSCTRLEPLVRAQNQPSVPTKPTPCFLALDAMAPLVWICVLVSSVEQVLMFELWSSRQSVGSRRWPGASPTTITLIEARFIAALREATGVIARRGPHVRDQLPMMSVTSGRSADARAFAQRYQARHPRVDSAHVRGMHATLTNGMTTQRS